MNDLNSQEEDRRERSSATPGLPQKSRLSRVSAFLFLKLSPFLLLALLVLSFARPQLIERARAWIWTNPAEFSDYKGRVNAQVVQERNMPDWCVIFLGDSITEGLTVRSITEEPAMNWGIGKDTTVGILWRLPHYRNLNKARCIVLAIGINDLSHLEEAQIVSNYAKILDALPPEVPLMCCSVLPINEAVYKQANSTWLNGRNVTSRRIERLNGLLRDLCDRRPGTRFVETGVLLRDAAGNLRGELTADGLHPNPLGMQALMDVLLTNLAKFLAQQKPGSTYPATISAE